MMEPMFQNNTTKGVFFRDNIFEHNKILPNSKWAVSWNMQYAHDHQQSLRRHKCLFERWMIGKYMTAADGE